MKQDLIYIIELITYLTKKLRQLDGERILLISQSDICFTDSDRLKFISDADQLSAKLDLISEIFIYVIDSVEDKDLREKLEIVKNEFLSQLKK